LLIMRFLLRFIVSCLAAGSTLSWAQGGAVQTDQVRAELVAQAPQGIVAGKPVKLGLFIRHRPQWHTYWKNPGDSGLPTRMEWQLPPGVTAGAIEWPTPHRLPVPPLVNYGYEGDLLLPVPLEVAPTFTADTLVVKLHAEWLVCKDVCIPESGDFTARWPTAQSLVEHGALFDAAQAAMPQAVPVRAQARVQGQALVLEAEGLPAEMAGQEMQFFPELPGVIENAAQPEQRWEGGKLVMRVPLSSMRSESPARMEALLKRPQDARAISIAFDVQGPWPAAGATPAPEAAPVATAAPKADASLWASLALAFGGGLLLNLMPCVFPVLSLKMLALARHADDRRASVVGALAYTAGVLVSFLALAGLLLALRAGGEQLGWGFQLQAPLFVGMLAMLFTLIGLNLAGVFEFTVALPGNLAGFQARHPVVDHAATGVLAVAIASPCTAPFMGAALGAALTLPAAHGLAVFAALGLGMSAPFLAAAAWPALANLLPRPGAWMAHFRALLAFPMFATVVWLVWVLGQQVGIDGAAALLGVLVAVSLLAWVMGRRDLKPMAQRVLAVLSLALLAGTINWAWPALREPAAASQPAAAERWQPWSAQAVAAARAEGRPVFVDFTAAWCVTCQVNKRTTLKNEAVLADFEARRVRLLRADWTRRDSAITAELARLGRSGVPVYALYPPGGGEPRLLTEILSVSEVRDALAQLPSAAPSALAPRLP
jgi:thiol:disulfide interchange protein DsbD